MSQFLPSSLGGPVEGRPIVDSDEYGRINSALNRMMFFRPVSGGRPYRNLLSFYNAMLVGAIFHVGYAAVRIVPTACVFFGRDGRLNLAFNPYYLDQIQDVLVAWPEDSDRAHAYATGAVDGNVWLVVQSFLALPSFVRASFLRGRLEEHLREKIEKFPWPDGPPDTTGMRASEMMAVLGLDEEERKKLWSMGASELGVPTDRVMAVRIDNRKLIALCVHEILHVSHLHLLIDRTKFDDPRILGLAVDIAIDQFIDDVPDDQWEFHRTLFERFVPMGEAPLEPNRSFDHYYRRLKDFYDKYGNKTTQTPAGPVTIVCGPTRPHGPPAPAPAPAPGQGPGSPRPGPPGPPGEPPAEVPQVIVVPQTVDDHTPWKPPDEIDVFSHQAFAQQFRDKAKQNPLWGEALGDLLRKIEEFLEPTVRWAGILRRWIGDKIRVGREPTRKRPSRRLGWEAAGRKTVRSTRILVAVDNSGSVTAAEAAQFFGEISSFLPVIEVVVCIWDTAIHQVVRVRNRGHLLKLAEGIGGGGGTNVLPVFKAVAEPASVTRPEIRALFSQIRAIVVLTDGALDFPDPEWGVRPTLWGITRKDTLGGPKFGTVLFVDVEKGIEGKKK